MSIKYTPHDYQVFTTEKIKATPKVLAVLEMGLGKTISTLTAINDLMFNSLEVNKVLVIAPLKVADITWSEEVEKWNHLTNLKISKVLGTEKNRINALNQKADIFCINRENVVWLIDYYIQQKNWPFDCIVIDESSSFKNQTSKRFKAIKKVVGIANRVILLTGTPTPNGLLDLWAQMFLIDKGERLETGITKFRDLYFIPWKINRGIVYSYKLKPKADKIIYKKIADVSISLQAADHLQMPERIDNYIRVKMPIKIKRIYEELEKEYILELDDDVITAGTAGVVANKLLQISNGAVYDSDKKVIEIHDLKLVALEEIIETNEGKSIMVFYNFQHDLMRLKKRFKHLNPRTLDTHQDKKDWDEGKVTILLAHPASMGHGLNLQAGGNIIVWFGLTWSLELYQQANARLYRQGQKESVIINHLITEGTEDENIVSRLQLKKLSQDDLIESIKAKIKKYKGELTND